MKKVTVFLAAMVFALMVSVVSFADEISFRNVAWGENISSTIEALSDVPVVWKDPIIGKGIPVENQIKQKTGGEKDFDCIFTVESKSSSLKVAGYPVDKVTLYFAAVPNSSGKIDHQSKNTALYMAKYTITPSDLTAAMTDLTTKLSGIYGDVKKTDDSSDCSSTYTYVQWSGSNNTTVTLVGEVDDINGHDKVYIYYATDNGNTWMNTAEQLQRQAEIDAMGEAGSDGL